VLAHAEDKAQARGVAIFAYANNHYAGNGPATVREFEALWDVQRPPKAKAKRAENPRLFGARPSDPPPALSLAQIPFLDSASYHASALHVTGWTRKRKKRRRDGLAGAAP
jgi:hypothetical protein